MYWLQIFALLSLLYIHETAFSFKNLPKTSESNSLIVERGKYHYRFNDDDDEFDFGSGSNEIDFGGSGHYLSSSNLFNDDERENDHEDSHIQSPPVIENNEEDSREENNQQEEFTSKINDVYFKDEIDEVKNKNEIQIEASNDFVTNEIEVEEEQEISIDNVRENSTDDEDRNVSEKVDFTTEAANFLMNDDNDDSDESKEKESTNNRMGKSYETDAVEVVNSSCSKTSILCSFVNKLTLLYFMFLFI